MDVPFVIRHRLEELGLEQQDLASAARVTESYISQLLTGKKPPHGLYYYRELQNLRDPLHFRTP